VADDSACREVLATLRGAPRCSAFRQIAKAFRSQAHLLYPFNNPSYLFNNSLYLFNNLKFVVSLYIKN
jgi:hypothetical protein